MKKVIKGWMYGTDEEIIDALRHRCMCTEKQFNECVRGTMCEGCRPVEIIIEVRRPSDKKKREKKEYGPAGAPCQWKEAGK